VASYCEFVQEKMAKQLLVLGQKVQEEATRQRIEQNAVIMLSTYTDLADGLVRPLGPCRRQNRRTRTLD
jgi:hypothetical protein